jgi:phosphatidylglycerophosphatase A
LILLFTVLGIWSSTVLEPEWGKDPSCIVVDEMAGVWISLLAVGGASLWYAALAFVLFRLFDIYKPLGIRRLERLKGGWGVMMDDVLAGLYAYIIVWGVIRLVD